jgi:hypothetical protein
MPFNPLPICRFCELRPAKRRRGLCALCYETRKIRKRYDDKPISPRANRGVDFVARKSLRPLPEPTFCPPGSEAKVEVFIKRRKAKESLWHLLDARDWEDWEELE